MKKLVLYGAASLVLVVLFSFFRAETYHTVSYDQTVDNIELTKAIDVDKAAQHLSKAIQFQTVSYDDEAQIAYQPYRDFVAWMAQTYPLTHSALTLTMINDFTFLFHWSGTNPEHNVLISHHYDVVPAANAKAWQVPPFAGVIKDDYIWGRGTLDDKGGVIAVIEAVETLVAQGFTPKNDIYLAFTHDEEIGSEKGAQGVAKYILDNNIDIEWSLDEGSYILDGLIPGAPRPVASINVSEKGYLNIRLTATVEAGHSSMPPAETAVDILTKALFNIRKVPLQVSFDSIAADMFEPIIPHMPYPEKLLFANQWLFGGLIENEIVKSDAARAMLGTTIAPTMLAGSAKSNVLPIEASAIINFRLHPRDTVEGIVTHLQQAIDDEQVEVTPVIALEASKVASTDTDAFADMATITTQLYDRPIITAGLTIGGTDSRFYNEAVANSYRFSPHLVTALDIKGFHGIDERLSLDNFGKALNFYTLLFAQH